MYSVLIMNICSNFLALSRNHIWLRLNKRSEHRKSRLDLGLLFPTIVTHCQNEQRSFFSVYTNFPSIMMFVFFSLQAQQGMF